MLGLLKSGDAGCIAPEIVERLGAPNGSPTPQRSCARTGTYKGEVIRFDGTQRFTRNSNGPGAPTVWVVTEESPVLECWLDEIVSPPRTMKSLMRSATDR
jgi:hypothetical protein